MKTTWRDEDLGSALRELDVPDHGARFYAELDRLLDDRVAAASRPRRQRFRIAVPAAVLMVVAVGGAIAVAIVRRRRRRSFRATGHY